MWKRRSSGGIQQLAEERKVLAERYTIDADEASRRERLAAEEAERRAAAEEAARLAAEESARRAAEAEARTRAAEQEAAREAASVARQPELGERAVDASLPLVLGSRAADGSPAAEAAPELPVEDAVEQTAELPIYRWFGS